MSSESSDSDYLRVASTAVPGISEVRLYRDTWEHIRKGHPEVEAVGEEGVLQTVQSPSQIFVSHSSPDKGYVFTCDYVTYMDNPLFVPVMRVEGSSARIATAYFRSNPYPGDLLWERNDDA